MRADRTASTRKESNCGEPAPRNPTTGMAGCSARAAKGSAAVAPRVAMNWRRRMADLHSWMLSYPPKGLLRKGASEGAPHFEWPLSKRRNLRDWPGGERSAAERPKAPPKLADRGGLS